MMLFITQMPVYLILTPKGVKNALEKAINFVAEDISCYVRDPSSDMTRKRVIGPEKVIKFLICKQGKSIASEICDQVDEHQSDGAS